MMMWSASGQSEVVVCGEIEPDMMSSADSLYPPFLLLLSFYLPHLATFILSSAFSSSIQTQSSHLPQILRMNRNFTKSGYTIHLIDFLWYDRDPHRVYCVSCEWSRKVCKTLDQIESIERCEQFF